MADALEDARAYRVAHADGSEWTGDELGAWDDMRVEWTEGGE